MNRPTDPHDQHPAAAQLLRDAVDDLPVDVDLLVRGGTSRGRAIRRRRRVGASLSAAVVVGAVAVAASVGPGLLDDADRGRLPAAGSGPSASDAAPVVPERRELYVSSEEIPSVFADLFPGEVADDPNADSIDLGPYGADFLWQGFETRVTFESAELVARVPTRTPMERCRRAGRDATGCTQLADGTVVQTRSPRASDPPELPVLHRSAWAYTPDGWTVEVSAGFVRMSGVNGPDVTPLTLEQVVEGATSDEWFTSDLRQVETATDSVDPAPAELTCASDMRVATDGGFLVEVPEGRSRAELVAEASTPERPMVLVGDRAFVVRPDGTAYEERFFAAAPGGYYFAGYVGCAE